MNAAETLDVAIVGGGVAGAASACALGGAGLAVVLFERRGLEDDINRGDSLELSAVEHLRGWEALPELERRGAFWIRRTELTTPQGRPRVRLRLDDTPILQLSHASIELGLLEAARQRGVEVRKRAVRSVERDGAGWRVATDDGEAHVRLLVGADGARSLVRRSAGIETDGEDYRQATVVLHAPRPKWLAADASWALIHQDGGVLILPTAPPEGSCRIVVQVEEDELPRWRGASPRELRWLLGRRCERLADLAIERRSGSHVYRLEWRHARRYVSGGLALVGDAAHVTHPNGGQGMALAIHDAAALSRLVLPVLRATSNGRGELREALWEYAALRRPASADAIARADRVAKLQRQNRAAYAAAWALLGVAALAPPITARMFNSFGGE